MKPVNENQKSLNDDSTWYLLAEYSLSEVPVVEEMVTELTAGSVFQAMRELGMSPECLKSIEQTITYTAKKARDPYNTGKSNTSVQLYLFCQAKAIEGLLHSEGQEKGGWGHFCIQRGRDFEITSYRESYSIIELYLYKEGE